MPALMYNWPYKRESKFPIHYPPYYVLPFDTRAMRIAWAMWMRRTLMRNLG